MSWLAVWLVGLGLGDLVGATVPSAARVLVGSAVAYGSALALALLGGLTRPADLAVLGLALVPLVAWFRQADAALEAQRRRSTRHLAALALVGVPPLVMLALSGWASPVTGPIAAWMAWAQLPVVHGHDVGRVLLAVGLVLVNLATGNAIVRLVLVSVGALPPGSRRETEDAAEGQLRGGRLLGPMERVFIIGLGLAGEVTAASIVIAAKGLLRFPELQAKRGEGDVRGAGIDQVTEYFLVGSFVSWLLALGSLALTR